MGTYEILITGPPTSPRNSTEEMAGTRRLTLAGRRADAYSHTGRAQNRSGLMLDIVLVSLGVALFAATFGYAYICDWL